MNESERDALLEAVEAKILGTVRDVVEGRVTIELVKRHVGDAEVTSIRLRKTDEAL